tara:strand:- start:210 stop:449 length:240 start_codon:yes stop_codon:yes gene_type:complete
MTDQEKKDTLDNMLICYVDRTYLTNKQIEESEIFVEELRAAISVTRCCEEFADGKCKPMVNADWTYLRCECGKRLEPKG